MAFNPKHLSFEEGKKRTLELMNSVDLKKILTSQDNNIKALEKELVVGEKGVPKGFVKWQLPPFFFPAGCLNYFSYGAPNAEVGEHSHDEGQQLRIIMTGSISLPKLMFVLLGTPSAHEIHSALILFTNFG